MPGDWGCPPTSKFPQDWGIKGVDENVCKRSNLVDKSVVGMARCARRWLLRQLLPRRGQVLNKIFKSFDAAVADIPDGATIAIESWGIPACAQNLVDAVKRRGIKDITLVTHNFIPIVLGEDETCFT